VAKSDRVERILCGIGQCLKQESAGISRNQQELQNSAGKACGR
jgi:hypothetical protein